MLLCLALGDSSAASGSAAHEVLARSLGAEAERIELQLVPGQNAGDWYQVGVQGGRLRVRGANPVALVHGSYAYLQSIGAAQVSWEGNRVRLPKAWPATDGRLVVSPFRHRAYLNTCTYGYSTPFWDWPRWQREIDWMALHGIDLPLAMEGQELVWQRLWREERVSRAELADYFSGPAFTPWQRMGNIEGYQAPLPQEWIDKKAALQKKILARLHDLGMTPILPAFSGYVPKAFALAHPQARIYRMRPWEGFHETYWLDPADPLFGRIAKRFIELYTDTYGPGEYYLADAFNEMLPPLSRDGSDAHLGQYGDSSANSQAGKAAAPVAPQRKRARLADYGAALYEAIHAAAPNATWVMQGWLFGADQAFWSPDAIAAFLSKVPDDRLLLLDIGNDRYPGIWRKSAAFDGKPWVYGYVHNYGGSNPVYGDLDFYRRDLSALLADPGHGRLQGFGVFPEGLGSNSVVYEYLYSLAWEGPSQAFADWFSNYARARYGHTSAALEQAWGRLRVGVFGVRYWDTRWWRQRAGAYLLFKEPTPQIVDFAGHPGDLDALGDGLKQLLALAPEYSDAPLFSHDLRDFAGHYALQRVDQLLRQAVADYGAGRLAEGDALRARVETLARAIDALLAGQPESLAAWEKQAAGYSENKAISAYYLRNARAQVTLWGGAGNLSDYASKAWSGLVAGFYLPRWQQLLGALRAAASEGRPFDEKAFQAGLKQWQLAWVQSASPQPPAPAPAPADVGRAVAALLRQLDGAP